MENDAILEAAVRAQIGRLEAEILPLFEKWKVARDHLVSLTGEPYEIGTDIENQLGGGPRMRPRAVAPNLAQAAPAGDDRAYHSRQFNQKVVDEAVTIIEAHGAPLSAPEIHRKHSKQNQVPTEVLYRLLYNRVTSGSLMSLGGAFWMEGKDLPAGDWDLANAKRSKKRGEEI
ncbi:conserved hypothetical protein [Hyphomicrobiales bacterium]|jgi:hypothetical protein|nr:conserved hypothetical protein [Hyphomicrobiales bacterium]CAH1702849.1 hypothetical protein BOSEA1005_30721 [Hyphomicrobiales bacterium]CAI0347036.1 conserved hypothetical protein [Hyphomicrobiales bacterium]